MAQKPYVRSELLEKEYTTGVWLAVRGSVVLVGALILVWIFGIVKLGPLRLMMEIVAALGFVAGAVGGIKMHRARKVPTTTLYCPYCEGPNEFLQEPTESFTCESCNRPVEFVDGKMVEIRTITCPVCSTTHKLSHKVTSYTCDSCNRPLRLQDPKDPKKVVAENTDVMRNYDVLLTQIGRNPTDVAMALQDLLICNLPEARRQMENLPLTVVRNVPERKADAIRGRLRERGATAVIRPTKED